MVIIRRRREQGIHRIHKELGLEGLIQGLVGSQLPSTMKNIRADPAATARDRNNLDPRISFAELPNRFETLLFRHQDIGNDEIERVVSNEHHRLFAVRGSGERPEVPVEPKMTLDSA